MGHVASSEVGRQKVRERRPFHDLHYSHIDEMHAKCFFQHSSVALQIMPIVHKYCFVSYRRGQLFRSCSGLSSDSLNEVTVKTKPGTYAQHICVLSNAIVVSKQFERMTSMQPIKHEYTIAIIRKRFVIASPDSTTVVRTISVDSRMRIHRFHAVHRAVLKAAVPLCQGGTVELYNTTKII